MGLIRGDKVSLSSLSSHPSPSPEIPPLRPPSRPPHVPRPTGHTRNPMGTPGPSGSSRPSNQSRQTPLPPSGQAIPQTQPVPEDLPPLPDSSDQEELRDASGERSPQYSDQGRGRQPRRRPRVVNGVLIPGSPEPSDGDESLYCPPILQPPRPPRTDGDPPSSPSSSSSSSDSDSGYQRWREKLDQ